MGSNFDIDILRQFSFKRVLDDDPLLHTLCLLGTLPSKADETKQEPAIISLHRNHLVNGSVGGLIHDFLDEVKPIESNDIYHWAFGWFRKNAELPDLKLNIICPATEVHIQKVQLAHSDLSDLLSHLPAHSFCPQYTRQRVLMVKETPEMYEALVRPYIASFPPSRFEWVFNILSHKVESEKILFEDTSPEKGFLLIPDMKWDLMTVSSLYLVAITHSRSISTLRDLRKEHLPMLKSIRRETGKVVKSKWGLEGESALRFYIHYQPSYYHFHVHVVNANYSGFKGVSAGQAHLLEDIISLLELSSPTGPTLISQMTLTYQLGERHGLFKLMVEAQDKINEEAGNEIAYA